MNKILVTLMTLFLCTVSSAFGALETPVNGTVWDNVSGLMWQQATASTTGGNEFQWGNPAGCDGTTDNEIDALCYCDGLTLDSDFDWRLADRNELLSIVDYARADPAINITYFPTTASTFYWTSTTTQEYEGSSSNHDAAKMINFTHGGIFSDQKTETHRVRCVRGRLYRITSTAAGPGTITPDGDQEGDYGTAVTYTMDPDPGEIITQIVVDSVTVPPPPGGYVQDQNETYEFPATTAGRHTINVAFTTVVHTITVTNDTGCTIDPAGPTVLVVDGDDQAFTYGATDHFTLTDVLVESVSVIGTNPTSYTFTAVAADQTIETQCTEETTNTLTVVVSGQGTVTSDPGGINCVDGSGDCNHDYYESESVTLTAIPDAGMTFSGWGGACTGTGACTVTMDTAKNVTSEFAEKSSILMMIMGVLGAISGR